jgi:hypothetical protein
MLDVLVPPREVGETLTAGQGQDEDLSSFQVVFMKSTVTPRAAGLGSRNPHRTAPEASEQRVKARQTMHTRRLSLVLALAAVTATALAPAASANPRSGDLHIEKDCTGYTGQAGQTCTITSSNLRAIPAGSVITYASDLVGATLDSDITVAAGPGNVAYGHCTLDFTALPGVCRLSGGTGRFTHIHAQVSVSPLGDDVWAWDGTFAFGSGS